MKNIMIVVILVILTSISYSQINYFVAKNGTGNFSTVAQVNSASLNPGDIVSFKSGDRFADAVLSCKQGVTYTSYGTGQAIIGDSLKYISPDNTIWIDNEGVTLKNLKIYGYRQSNRVIRITKGNLTIDGCTIIGGLEAHERAATGIRTIALDITKPIKITNNVIRNLGCGVYLNKPYSVDISYNEIYDIWIYPGFQSIGGIALNFSPGNGAPGPAQNTNYTLHIHHNNIHHFEHSAVGIGQISRALVEYNEVHDNLDERLYQGGVTNGNFGKVIDNQGLTSSSIGSVIRYNYVYNLKKYGQPGYKYGRPTLEQVKADTIVVLDNNTGLSTPIYSGAGVGGTGDAVNIAGGVFAGGGYGNIWIHNNLIYNCGGITLSRGMSKVDANGIGAISGTTCAWNGH